jgi:hypothetical protein
VGTPLGKCLNSSSLSTNLSQKKKAKEKSLPHTTLHIVKDVVVVKLFPSIHPWMASYREENPGRNK